MLEAGRRRTRLFTLLDPNSANPGSVWLYTGESEECLNCSVRELCHGSLFPGMSFEVLEKRGAKNYCKVRDLDIETVEICRLRVKVAIDSRLAKEGAIMEYNTSNCYKEDCPFVELCEPLELRNGQKIKVIEVMKSFPCPIEPDRSLSMVDVEPL